MKNLSMQWLCIFSKKGRNGLKVSAKIVVRQQKNNRKNQWPTPIILQEARLRNYLEAFHR